MHPGRILGVVMGLVILAAIFFLPFTSMLPYTLYDIVGPLLGAIGGLQNLPTPDMIFSYVLIVAFILLVVAGLVGFFPLGTGVLGIVGMATLSIAPYLLYGFPLLGGAGFYTLWGASIVALGASFWHRRAQPPSQVVQVNVQPPPPPQPTPTSPTAQVPTPSPQTSNHRSLIVVSPTIDVKTETKTEPRMPPPPLPELEMERKAGVNYTPEEAMKMFLMLKERVESLPAEQAKATMSMVQFKDVSGRIWTIDLQTTRWVFNDGKKWVEATPPPVLVSA